MVGQNSHTLIIWLLILTSASLVAVITYVYTNRNLRLTGLFTLFSLFSIAVIKLVGIVENHLNNQFIGQFDNHQIPYVALQPGWHQIIYAWHIWILPVLISSAILCFIFYILSFHTKNIPLIEMLSSIQPTVKPNPIKKSTDTSSNKLSKFVAADIAKRETAQMNEKLAEVLLINAAQEIKISDLNIQLREMQREIIELNRKSSNEATTLQLELSLKVKENTHLSQQLIERTNELARAQEMFEKILLLQQEQKNEVNSAEE